MIQTKGIKRGDFSEVEPGVKRVVSTNDGAGFGIYCQRLEMTWEAFGRVEFEISRELELFAMSRSNPLKGLEVDTSVNYKNGCMEVAISGYAGEEKEKVEKVVPAIIEMACRKFGIEYVGPNAYEQFIREAAGNMPHN